MRTRGRLAINVLENGREEVETLLENQINNNDDATSCSSALPIVFFHAEPGIRSVHDRRAALQSTTFHPITTRDIEE